MINFNTVYLMSSFHSNKDCVVCLIVKHKRLPFPNFNHLFDHSFDLIHCDVWGPFAKATHDGFKYFLTIVDYKVHMGSPYEI